MRFEPTLNPKPYTLNPIPLTLSPRTLDKKKRNNPKGGVGENEAAAAEKQEKAGFLNLVLEGSRAKGFAATQAELTGGGFTHKEVYEAFLPLLAYHSILSLESFYNRLKHCKATPAQWLMLFLDKVHAVYRKRGGSTLADGSDADPVGMTVAGFLPRKGGKLHYPTDAARQLFIEIMRDYAKFMSGEKSRWNGKMSAATITLELDRRKGKAGRIS